MKEQFYDFNSCNETVTVYNNDYVWEEKTEDCVYKSWQVTILGLFIFKTSNAYTIHSGNPHKIMSKMQIRYLQSL